MMHCKQTSNSLKTAEAPGHKPMLKAAAMFAGLCVLLLALLFASKNRVIVEEFIHYKKYFSATRVFSIATDMNFLEYNQITQLLKPLIRDDIINLGVTIYREQSSSTVDITPQPKKPSWLSYPMQRTTTSIW